MREAVRLLLWLQVERPGVTFDSTMVKSYLAYMAFL